MRTLCFALLLTLPLFAQRVDPALTSHYRVHVIVPVVNGRPAHVTGKLGFVVLAQHPTAPLVLAEIVALKFEDLSALRADAAATVFDKGLTKRSDVIAAARARGFLQADLDRIHKSFVRVP